MSYSSLGIPAFTGSADIAPEGTGAKRPWTRKYIGIECGRSSPVAQEISIVAAARVVNENPQRKTTTRDEQLVSHIAGTARRSSPAEGVATGQKGDALLPAVPPLSESGLPGYEMTGWHGFFAPGETPREIVTELNGAIVQILALPEMQGEEPAGRSRDSVAM